MGRSASVESPDEKLKTEFRQIFIAFQKTLSSWPGGAADIYRMLNWNPPTAMNQMNPSGWSHSPSLLHFLQLLEYTGSRPVAHELAELAGCITVPSAANRLAFSSNKAASDALGASMRRVLYKLDEMSSNPGLSASRSYRADLLQLIDAAHVMMMRLNG